MDKLKPLWFVKLNAQGQNPKALQTSEVSVLAGLSVEGCYGSAGAGDCESQLLLEVWFHLDCGTLRHFQGGAKDVLFVRRKNCRGGRVSCYQR